MSNVNVVSGHIFSIITNFLSKLPAGQQIGATAEGPYTVHSVLSMMENTDHVQKIESAVNADLLTVQNVAAAVKAALGSASPIPAVGYTTSSTTSGAAPTDPTSPAA